MIFYSIKAKFWHSFVQCSVVGIFILAAMLLYTQLFIIYGTQKEKANKMCADPLAIEEWNKALALATTACDEGRALKIGIKDKEIETLQAEVDKWIGSYNWLKRQQDALIIKPEGE